MLLPQKPAAHAHGSVVFSIFLMKVVARLSVVAKQLPVKLSQLWMLGPVMVHHPMLMDYTTALCEMLLVSRYDVTSSEQEHDQA